MPKIMNNNPNVVFVQKRMKHEAGISNRVWRTRASIY